MDVTTLLVTLGRSLVKAPLSPRVRSPFGGASLGMLMTLVDVGASGPALASAEDWTAIQDLSIYGVGGVVEGPIVVDSRLLRVGKKVIVAEADIYDGHGMDDLIELQAALDDAEGSGGHPGLSLAAKALITFARIPRSAARGVDDYDPSSWVGQIRRHGARSSVEGSVYELMGLRIVDAEAGQIELDRTPYVANSIGTINGGAQALLVEAAAEALCPNMVATDMQLHYLSQVKAGPARTSGHVLRQAADHGVVMIEIHDAGNDDQLLARATVTLVAPSR